LTCYCQSLAILVKVSHSEVDFLITSSSTQEGIMKIGLSNVNAVTQLNMSANARMTQALRVNDIGTAQRIAASAALMNGQFRTPPAVTAQAAQAAPAHHDTAHQVDTWA
jgi:hypothetical protein